MRFQPFTPIRYAYIFVLIYFQERFQWDAQRTGVDAEGLNRINNNKDHLIPHSSDTTVITLSVN